MTQAGGNNKEKQLHTKVLELLEQYSLNTHMETYNTDSKNKAFPAIQPLFM